MQTSYNRNMTPGRVGQLADSGFRDVIALINDYPRTAQVSTIVVDTAANSTGYAVTIDGEEVAVTSASSATKITIAAQLAAAINAAPLLGGRMTAVSDGVDTVTITANIAGEGFTLSDSDSRLTTATGTANDTADPVAFGAPVFRDPANDDYGRGPVSAAIVARSVDFTFGGTEEDSKVISGVITLDGVVTPFSFDTGSSATLASIGEDAKTAIDALGLDITTSEDTGVLTITVDTKGVAMEVAMSGLGLSTLTVEKTADNQSTLTDVETAFAGIALFEYSHESGVQYAGGESMSVLRQGRVHVGTTAAVTPGAQAYYDVVAGAYRDSAATSAVRLPGCKFHRSLSTTLATLQVR